MKNLLFLLFINAIVVSNSGFAQGYLGQPTPSSGAELFGSGIISTSLKERDITISPDGTEIYFTVFKNGFDGNIYFVKLENGEWSLPEVAPFSGNKEDLEPAFAPDGNKLFFASKRSSGNYDIWYVQRENGGAWSQPISVGSPVNTTANEFYPSIANDGSLYYTAKYSHGVGGEDIWYAKYDNGSFQNPVALQNVNGTTDEFNAFVDPDEQYIYFGSFGREDGRGGGDIYISRRQGNSWSEPEHLGNQVNTDKLDYSPFVSPDGLFLFFTSERGQSREGASTNPFDLSAITNSLLKPGITGSDIYWLRR